MKNKRYIIKFGKMYIKSIDMSEYDVKTEFISNIEFTSDKHCAYLKLNEENANYLIEKLYKVFNIYVEDVFEIEEVENEERE